MIEKKKPKVNVDPLELIAHLLNCHPIFSLQLDHFSFQAFSAFDSLR